MTWVPQRNQFEPPPPSKKPPTSVNFGVLTAIIVVAIVAMTCVYLIISHDKTGSNAATVTLVLGFAGSLIATLFTQISVGNQTQTAIEKQTTVVQEAVSEVKEALDIGKVKELVQVTVDATCKRQTEIHAQQIQNNTRALGEQAGQVAGLRSDVQQLRQLLRLLLVDSPVSEATKKALEDDANGDNI